MPAKVGVLSVADLLAARFQSVVQFGYERINQAIQADLAVWNRLVAAVVSEIAETSSERLRAYGTSDSGEMTEGDEFSRPSTQKPLVGTTVAFPMRLHQYAVGWTRKFFENKTPADLALVYLASRKAHKKKVIARFKKAIYLSTNFTYRDHLVDNVDLAVKRFLNADSVPIPEGPNGEVYTASTHTHYLANATLTAAFASSVVQTVVEHGNGGMVKLIISRTDEAAFRALTGFIAYQDPRIVLATNVSRIETPRQDITRLDDRAIGIFDAAEVWVKPWAIANYMFAYDQTAEQKPLVLRTRDGQGTGLRVAADIDAYPLHSQYMEDEFDFGVWNRTNGAVGYFASGTYADPAITG